MNLIIVLKLLLPTFGYDQWRLLKLLSPPLPSVLAKIEYFTDSSPAIGYSLCCRLGA